MAQHRREAERPQPEHERVADGRVHGIRTGAKGLGRDGKPLATVPDQDFARAFFAIWLVLLTIFFVFGIPFGPGVGVSLEG